MSYFFNVNKQSFTLATSAFWEKSVLNDAELSNRITRQYIVLIDSYSINGVSLNTSIGLELFITELISILYYRL